MRKILSCCFVLFFFVGTSECVDKKFLLITCGCNGYAPPNVPYKLDIEAACPNIYIKNLDYYHPKRTKQPLREPVDRVIDRVYADILNDKQVADETGALKITDWALWGHSTGTIIARIIAQDLYHKWTTYKQNKYLLSFPVSKVLHASVLASLKKYNLMDAATIDSRTIWGMFLTNGPLGGWYPGKELVEGDKRWLEQAVDEHSPCCSCCNRCALSCLYRCWKPLSPCVVYPSCVQCACLGSGLYNDPLHQNCYLGKCPFLCCTCDCSAFYGSWFLPYLNNEKYHKSYMAFKEAVSRIKKIVCMGGDKDNCIKPFYSSLFRFWISGSDEIIPTDFKATKQYTDDLLGLKGLYDRGDLLFNLFKGHDHWPAGVNWDPGPFKDYYLPKIIASYDAAMQQYNIQPDKKLLRLRKKVLAQDNVSINTLKLDDDTSDDKFEDDTPDEEALWVKDQLRKLYQSRNKLKEESKKQNELLKKILKEENKRRKELAEKKKKSKDKKPLFKKKVLAKKKKKNKKDEDRLRLLDAFELGDVNSNSENDSGHEYSGDSDEKYDDIKLENPKKFEEPVEKKKDKKEIIANLLVSVAHLFK